VSAHASPRQLFAAVVVIEAVYMEAAVGWRQARFLQKPESVYTRRKLK
jgi:hypothetical protein